MKEKFSLEQSPRKGFIISVHGSVVDIEFKTNLPSIYSVLITGHKKNIIIEVLAQLDERRVRGIALTPTQGLSRGMIAEDTGAPLKVPVGKEILSRMFDVFGNVIDRKEELKDADWRSGTSGPTSII